MLLNYFPNEIIVEIAVKLSLEDCSSFFRTNRHLYDLLHSYLYRQAARLIMWGKPYISVLHWAAAYGHDRVIGWLLERGTDPTFRNYLGITALHFAASAIPENVNVIKLLLEGGASFTIRAEDKSTALHMAAKVGRVGTVRLLLEQAVGVDRVILFAKNSMGVNPLHIAAEGGHEPVVRLLLEHGANIASTANSRYGGYTALHLACVMGNEKLVSLLLEKGADPNVQSGRLKGFRSTPLHCIASHCCQILWSGNRPHRLAKLLLEMGANIMASDMHGRTPLHWLTRSPYYAKSPGPSNKVKKIQSRLTRMFIQKGADINARDSRGYTALHLAVVKRHANLIRTLLACGADTELPDCTGKTPLQLALSLQLLKIATLFCKVC